jgi:RNA polymerase sigma-70 factor (ECF subfamily)
LDNPAGTFSYCECNQMQRYKNRLFGRAKLQKAISQAEGRAYKYYADLLWRLKNGDGSAWEQFVVEWGARLYSYLRYNTQRDEDAQHILSETMLAIVHEISNFDESVTLATFVYRLAYRNVIAYWRKYGKPDSPAHFNRVATTGNELEIRKAWLRLEEQSQQALLLRYQASLSVNEIANVLGRSHETIEALLSQVHRQFQNTFFSNTGA